MSEQEKNVIEEVEKARLTLQVSGQVQGVGFRYFVQRTVAHLAVTGFIRNDEDGTVSIVAEGPLQDLNRLLDAVSKGPTAARVDEVDTSWTSAFGAFKGFKVKLW